MSDFRKWDNGLDVPLFIAVTGHVDLLEDQLKMIRCKVRVFFEGLIQKYGNTKLVVMSALAEGADLLVAELALEMGLHVAPVLPMDLDDYKAGFRNQANCAIVDRILYNALTYTPYTLETVSECDRDSYRNLSAFLIFNSHILLALWDGREYDRNGGTYDTVRMAYQGVDADIRRSYLSTVVHSNMGRDRTRYLDSAEDCLIYRIEVGRQADRAELLNRGCSNPDCIKRGDGYIMPLMVRGSEASKCSDSVLDLGKDVPSTIMPEFYDSSFSRIDKLNRDVRALYGDIPICHGQNTPEGAGGEYGWDTRYGLLITKDPVVKGYVKEIKALGVMDAAAERYHVADQLAMNNQWISFSRIHLMILVTVLTTFFFSIFVLSGASLLVNVVFTVLMFAGIALGMLHKKSQSFSKFIEYRALAESMRVEYYRGLMGSREPVPEVCYGYMKNELFWIRSVLKSWNSNFLNDYALADHLSDKEEAYIAILSSCWIDNQMNYHSDKKRINTSKFAKVDKRSSVLLVATALISAVVIPLMAFFPDFMDTSLVQTEAMTLFGVIIIKSLDITVSVVIRAVMIILVALTSYVNLSSNMIHGGTPQQIGAKLQMFHIATIRLGESDDSGSKREILWELGDQCIEENNDWVFEHRSKDFRSGLVNVDPMDVDS